MRWTERSRSLVGLLLAAAFLIVACEGEASEERTVPEPATASVADVIDVSISGATGAYSFSITVASRRRRLGRLR